MLCMYVGTESFTVTSPGKDDLDGTSGPWHFTSARHGPTIINHDYSDCQLNSWTQGFPILPACSYVEYVCRKMTFSCVEGWYCDPVYFCQLQVPRTICFVPSGNAFNWGPAPISGTHRWMFWFGALSSFGTASQLVKQVQQSSKPLLVDDEFGGFDSTYPLDELAIMWLKQQ